MGTNAARIQGEGPVGTATDPVGVYPDAASGPFPVAASAPFPVVQSGGPFNIAVYRPGSGPGWMPEEAASMAAYLLSGVRSSTQTTFSLDNPSCSHLAVLLNVTANPGGAQSLTLEVQAWDSAVATWIPVAATAPLFGAGGTGRHTLWVGPGLVNTTARPDTTVQGTHPGANWRVQVQHSGAGNWTYSLAYFLGR